LITDNATIKTWFHHLQDEADAAFLYGILAGKEKNENKKKIYSQLSEVEEKHKRVWIELLKKNNIEVNNLKPSLKARLFAKIASKAGTGFLSKMMLREEGLEVKSYLGLYNSSSSEQTKDIALRLAKDSAEHSGRLTTLLETEGESWHKAESGGLLRNIIYGFNDGLTANFGLIAGIIGADVEHSIVLISGLSGMLADALSMGSSGYLAAVSEKEVYENEKRMEADEIRLMPELETEELSLIYRSKGMDKDSADKLSKEIISNPELALKEKVREELGISESRTSPFKEGMITGVSTAIGAMIPVFPFIFFEGTVAVWISFAISMAAHFIVGAARSAFTGRGIFRSGFDMFAVGIGVAVIGYFIGEMISKMF